MNRSMNAKIFCLLAVFVLCLLGGISCAETRVKWDYEYEIQEDGTALIVKYRGNKEEVEIPEDVDGYPVTAIGDAAFKLKRKVRYVSIPNGVVSIGSTAFSSCDGIEEIKLPKTLKSIGTKAFSNCKGLKSIVLPEGLESMGSNPFALCDNLTDISFTGPNQFYEVRDGALIQQEEHRLVSWLHMAKADGSYAVPNDIRIIGYDAFYICRDLTAVSLPEGLEVIEESAFAGCSELGEITLPETLVLLKNRAFGDCSKLVTVKIPDTLTDLAGNPFTGCTSLMMVAISDTHPTLEMREGSCSQQRRSPRSRSGHPAGSLPPAGRPGRRRACSAPSRLPER